MNTKLSAILAVSLPPILGFVTVAIAESGVAHSYRDIIDLITILSFSSLMLGIITLAIIALIAHLAQNNRKLLLTLFKPILKFTQLATVLLVISHGIIITASITFIEAYVFNAISPFIVLIIGVTAVWVAFKVLWFALTQFKEAEIHVLGKVINKIEQPKLWDLIEEVCKKTGSSLPNNIVLGLSPTFFVTEIKVLTNKEELSGKTLYLSLPFSRLLSEIELKAIIAHEMGHFVGQDTQFSKNFYPIYRGAINTMELLADKNAERGVGVVALYPSLAINSFFFSCFSSLENEIGRQRELEADAVAAKSFGMEKLAKALIKVHAYGAVWTITEGAMTNTLQHGEEIINASLYFAAFVRQLDMGKVRDFLEDCRTEHPTDSHPSLHSRLAKLDFVLTLDVLERMKTEGQSNVSKIIKDIELIEEELTSIENYKLIIFSKVISNVRRSYRKKAAQANKEEHAFFYHEILCKVLILTAMIDGKINDQEVVHLAKAFNRVTGEQLNRDDLIADIYSCEEWSGSLMQILEESRELFSEQEKVLLITAALLVATLDGDFAEKEMWLIELFAEKLGVNKDDLNKLMKNLFYTTEHREDV